MKRREIIAAILFTLALTLPALPLCAQDNGKTSPGENSKKTKADNAYKGIRFGVNIRLGRGRIDQNKLSRLLSESGSQLHVTSAFYQASIPFFQIVKNPGKNQTYNWSRLDRQVSDKAKRGIKSMIILSTYNHQRKCKMPSNMKSWKEFVKAVVKRYSDEARGGVKLFALNNEPSVPIFWNDTPENYAKLLRVTYETAKKANPEVKIVLGSMPTEHVVNQASRQKFFPKVIKYKFSNGKTAEDYFDVVDVHIYDKPSTFKKYVDFVRGMITKDKPFIMTETASMSDPKYGSTTEQARDVVKRFVIAFGLGIEGVTWQPLSDHRPPGLPPKVADKFATAGFLEENTLSPKPSYYTFKLMVIKLSGFTSVEQLKEGMYKFTFKDKKPAFVLWSDRKKKTVDISKHTSAKKMKLTHIIEKVGQSQSRTEAVSPKKIIIDESPVFVEIE